MVAGACAVSDDDGFYSISRLFGQNMRMLLERETGSQKLNDSKGGFDGSECVLFAASEDDLSLAVRLSVCLEVENKILGYSK